MRDRDRAIATRATMLLCDDTGMPEATLGRRHVKLLRGTLICGANEPCGRIGTNGDLGAIRAIALGEVEPNAEQLGLLDAVKRALGRDALQEWEGNADASDLTTRVVAAMLHAIAVGA